MGTGDKEEEEGGPGGEGVNGQGRRRDMMGVEGKGEEDENR